MSWVDDEIAKWHAWMHGDRTEHSTVPYEIQVGKALLMAKEEQVLRRSTVVIDEARKKIVYQLNQDSMSSLFEKDNYWQKVLDRFDFLMTNELIMQE